MQIKPYHKDHKAAVLHLISLNTPSYFAAHERKELYEYLDKFVELYYVAESEGEIIAAAGINFENDGKDATMSWDIIHPAHQGKGIGSLLVSYRIAIIKEQHPSVTKIVSRTSQLTEAFYKKQGFTTVKHIKDHWAPGIDLCTMELKI